MAIPGPKVEKSDKFKLVAYPLIAAGFFLAASGICIRPLNDVPPFWLVLAWIAALSWFFFLVRSRVFSQGRRPLFLFLSVVALQLMSQGTGGERSPLIFCVFLLMGVASWEGEARFGFWVAVSFCLLETVYWRREDSPLRLALYLRWAAYLATAFFLARIAGTRKEKEKLDQQLKTLKTDAVRLAAAAEPSSFNIPKDKLLKEEGRLSARVGTFIELEENLTRQLGLFRSTLGFQTAAFFLATELADKRVLRLRAFSSSSTDVATDVTLVPGETLVGLAAKENRRVLLNDIAPESARALPYYLKPTKVGSFLAQPILIKGAAGEGPAAEEEMAGVLVLDQGTPSFFNPRELELVDSFALLLGDVIQNVRVLHFSRAKSRNLHALFDVSKSFSTLLDMEMVLKTALNTAKEIAPCDSTYIALIEGDQKTFSLRAWIGPKTGDKLEDELAAWVLENKKPIRYTRGLREKGLGSFAKKEGMLGSTQSFLMVPLLSREDVMGVIRLNSSKPDAYQSYDQDVLTTLANQTALALENAMMVHQIQEMATKDGLTGVFNHRYFQEKLGEEMAKAERYNKDLCLVLLDVDHFKKFNDNYGHQEGDKVLRVVSQVIQGTVRKKVDTVARYGGEEFVVILPETDSNAGKEWAERIRKNIEAHLFENNGKPLYRVTVSIGVASFPFDSKSQKELIQLADQALYAAKRNGRNRVQAFQSGL